LSQVERGEIAARRREPLIPSIRVTPEERNRLILVAVAALVLFWLLRQSFDALGPFLFALGVAYLMSPLVDRLDRFLPRSVAILVVYAIFIGISVALMWWLAPRVSNQIGQLVDAAPAYQKRIQEYIDSLTQWYQSLPLSADVRTSIENGLRNAAGSLLGLVQQAALNVLAIASRTTGFVLGFVIIPFWLFYVLKDSEKAMGAFNSMLPRSWRVDVWRIVRIVNDVLSSYIRGQLLLALAVGLATTIGMLLVGAPYALLLGLLSGFTEVIPVIGPVIGAIPGVLIALVNGDWVLLLKVVLVYVVVQQLENNLLVPKIQGDSVKLHPAVIMVALVVGSQVGGLIGLILAVPVAAIMRDIYLYLYRRLAEDYTPRDAEASLPTHSDEETPQGKAHEAHELELAHRMPGINTQEEMIEAVDKESADAEAAGRK
jgi:predicted PurR-regulated permease PerM